jgi:hypothetical protein
MTPEDDFLVLTGADRAIIGSSVPTATPIFVIRHLTDCAEAKFEVKRA